MASRAAETPSETDLLCEQCGYVLNGLPASGNCPECGRPIATSTTDDGRRPSGFEASPSAFNFVKTTTSVWFSPRAFYRSLTTRTDSRRAWIFAAVHRVIASMFLAVAFGCHLAWISQTFSFGLTSYLIPVFSLGSLGLIYALLTGITSLAAWLSAAEGRYWGMRLPLGAVRRAMRFHQANYVPVALVAAIMTAGHLTLLATRSITPEASTTYLYLLSGYVIVAAIYLFQAYWIAMRNVMYANR